MFKKRSFAGEEWKVAGKRREKKEKEKKRRKKRDLKVGRD
jgi:hypothetical protein